MSLDKFQSWLNFFQTLEGPKNIDALIIAVLISAVIFFAYIAIKNIKLYLFDTLIYFLITIIINLFCNLLFNNYFLLISISVLSPALSNFIIKKFNLLEFIDKNIIERKKEITEEEIRKKIVNKLPPLEKSDLDEFSDSEYKFLVKNYNFIPEIFETFNHQEILDILFLYGYISYKQKEKIQNNLMFGSTSEEEKINQLKNNPIISEDDYNMAILLIKYIISHGKIPSIKKAVEELVNERKRKEEEIRINAILHNYVEETGDIIVRSQNETSVKKRIPKKRQVTKNE